ncbi:MAG: hypothetical protein ACK4NS_04785 [Saprospiraceae bacterium]
MSNNGDQTPEPLSDRPKRVVDAREVSFALPLSEIRAIVAGLFSFVSILAVVSYNLGTNFARIAMLEKRAQDLQEALSKKVQSDEVEIAMRFWNQIESMNCVTLEEGLQRMQETKKKKGCAN